MVSSKLSSHAQNTLALRLGGCLCAVTLVLGLIFCLVSSPKMMAEKYTHQAVIALEAGDYAQSRAAMISALRHDPTRIDSWKILSRVLERGGQMQEARTANAVIAHLTGQATESDPLYAMPADLRLSFLAMTGGDSY